jgi:RNA polymerase sigma-70 factor, ECF subfamily
MPGAIRNGEQKERLPDRLGVDPQAHAEATAILAAIRRVIGTGLTAYEQRVFVAIVVDGVPLDALAARPGVRLF